MPQLLSEVWGQVEGLLSQGLSLIPVRDKDQGEYKAKSPYPKWKQYQTSRIDTRTLYEQMDKTFDTTALAIICGKVSGNLEVIDIDVKNWPGIDGLLLSQLKTINPDLFGRLRIHKSPSGGFHLLYKIADAEAGPNIKLATKKDTKGAAIETRGEGGYVLAPPSMNYRLIQNPEIPVITWQERCFIIEVCKSFNENVKVEKPAQFTKQESTYYDENPFDHYNGSVDAPAMICEFGWTVHSAKGNAVWLCRPGKKNDVHGAFFTDKRLFYFFTTSEVFEAEKCFRPATVMAMLRFGGDKKRAYAWLCQNGYGKVKPRVEQETIKRAAISGEKLPANFSPEAKTALTAAIETQTEAHPFGTFWKLDDDGKMSISREGVYNVAHAFGFRVYDGELYRIDEPFIYKQSSRDFYDLLKSYIKIEDANEYEEVCNTYESFMQRAGKFTMERIMLLPESDILKDTRNACFKFFKNGYLYITADEIEFLQYQSLSKLVFYDRVQQRDYEEGAPGVYEDFISKALGGITDNTRRAIGFLTHEYKDETTAYIIVCIERCADPKHGGGSGKNVFCQLLSYSTTYISKPGAQTKFDEKFFQTWNGQRVFAISDVPKGFDFSFLKEPASGSFIWKKLFKDETIVPVERAPKFIVQTNFSYDVSDGGLKRRIIPIEFTDFFTNAGGLDVYYGKHFPNDWQPEDWAGYDTFIAGCIQKWISGGRKLSASELTITGWHKQFSQTYGQTIHDLLQEYWIKWIELSFVGNDAFKADCEKFYIENSIPLNYRPSSQRINTALAEYAAKFKVHYVKDAVKKENSISIKGRSFSTKPPEDAPF